jgi:hypothetical protein
MNNPISGDVIVQKDSSGHVITEYPIPDAFLTILGRVDNVDFTVAKQYTLCIPDSGHRILPFAFVFILDNVVNLADDAIYSVGDNAPTFDNLKGDGGVGIPAGSSTNKFLINRSSVTGTSEALLTHAVIVDIDTGATADKASGSILLIGFLV